MYNTLSILNANPTLTMYPKLQLTNYPRTRRTSHPNFSSLSPFHPHPHATYVYAPQLCQNLKQPSPPLPPNNLPPSASYTANQIHLQSQCSSAHGCVQSWIMCEVGGWVLSRLGVVGEGYAARGRNGWARRMFRGERSYPLLGSGWCWLRQH